MFLTLTIETKQKNKPRIRLQTKRIDPTGSWRKALNAKKRSLWQRIKSWKRKVSSGCYKLGGQIAMF